MNKCDGTTISQLGEATLGGNLLNIASLSDCRRTTDEEKMKLRANNIPALSFVASFVASNYPPAGRTLVMDSPGATLDVLGPLIGSYQIQGQFLPNLPYFHRASILHASHSRYSSWVGVEKLTKHATSSNQVHYT